ncbi:PAS domain-containing protein [Dongia sp.]|uniref:PAS domain-containing protein n=1 Tax=Dongia sp. TaxID=1977262 RepID=UPI003751ECE8
MTTEEQEWLGEILYLAEPSGRSEMIALVRRHWETLRAGRRFPARAEIDPTAIYNALPYVSVLQYQHAPFRIQFRLVGNEVDRLYGSNVQGKFIDEMEWAPHDIIDTTHIYDRLYREATPLFGLSYTDFQSKADRVFEWAVFPLSDDGERVSHAISIDDYTMVTPRGGKLF